MSDRVRPDTDLATREVDGPRVPDLDRVHPQQLRVFRWERRPRSGPHAGQRPAKTGRKGATRLPPTPLTLAYNGLLPPTRTRSHGARRSPRRRFSRAPKHLLQEGPRRLEIVASRSRAEPSSTRHVLVEGREYLPQRQTLMNWHFCASSPQPVGQKEPSLLMSSFPDPMRLSRPPPLPTFRAAVSSLCT